MERLLEEILAYLEYLNTACGLRTTVHFAEETVCRFPEDVFKALLPYNTHDNPYCMLAKKKAWHRCLAAQKALIHGGGENGHGCRTCYAGVREYVYTVAQCGAPVGFVAVSGYRREADRQLCLDPESWETHLRCRQIPQEQCDILIAPLARMLELLMTYPMSGGENGEWYRMIQYIHEKKGQVTLDELCGKFLRSRSYISHLFQRTCHMTLCRYCNALKLDYARTLLLASSRQVTEIALDAGFQDVSYFIALFRKTYGHTPLQYRKNCGHDGGRE